MTNKWKWTYRSLQEEGMRQMNINRQIDNSGVSQYRKSDKKNKCNNNIYQQKR